MAGGRSVASAPGPERAVMLNAPRVPEARWIAWRCGPRPRAATGRGRLGVPAEAEWP